ncbi:putative AAA family ATPase RIX7 [Sugiyamaella lignohabitans]|uniref:Peroxisomal ATPase PEX1 n=1 Tax=Sugiyamaella lignohabitans TaxID=796027 RepID=A0A167D395_9ASCO|nr:putative AAA family ATPase RIX7 [Sugiyamaella lignohabitans]ANB12425.1 putative AAA family ATPase RIX7 [Sugiyamaella lignohabitans]
MRPRPRKNPGSANSSLDKTVYRLVKEYLEEQALDDARKKGQLELTGEDDEEDNEDDDSLLAKREAELNLLLNLRKLRVTEAIDICQRAELSLRRVKRVALEESVGKAFELIRKEEREKQAALKEEQQLDSDFEGVDIDSLMDVKDTNQMNKNVINLWDIPPAEPIARIARLKTGEEDESKSVSKGDGVNELGSKLAASSLPGSGTATPVVATSRSDLPPEKKKAKKESDKKRKDKIDRRPAINISLSDIGGVDRVIKQLLEMVAWPLSHPEVYTEIGSDIPRGVLLHGPPGCGKTMLANALANDLGVAFINVSAPSVVSGMSGESEKKLREIFDEAKTLAPCLLFIDEIDAITPKRESAQREMERRIVAQLLTCMDDVSMEKTGGKPVMIIGATNRPDAIDSALRRGGRFDREICMSVPDQEARQKILETMSRKLKLQGGENFNFKRLAKLTPGYVGADLNALVTAAGACAIKRVLSKLPGEQSKEDDIKTSLDTVAETNTVVNDMEVDDVEEQRLEVTANGSHMEPDSVDSSTGQIDITITQVSDEQANPPVTTEVTISNTASTTSIPPNEIKSFLTAHPDPLTPEQLSEVAITFEDFLTALPSVQPSSKREGFTTVPDVTWDDVGAMSTIREELEYSIVESIKNPELYAAAGIRAPSGVLLWGPPGCGKTLLAKAVANESQANFISVRGPELLNKYVGESERAVRQVFVRARASEPCVIFFDELDALVPRRDDSNSESSSRVVNTLLTELDGVGDRKGVYVIAATNRPDMIDSAMLRPGRLDKQLYVELPTADERVEILKTVTRTTPTHEDVDLAIIGHDERCRNFSGADLANLTREAAGLALRTVIQARKKLGNFEDGPADVRVTAAHFEEAFSKVRASVSDSERAKYSRMKQRSA